ncbi:MAG: hypothetical protein E7646_09065 [Ruminococcaceae bacterium]|nr:hypothetical protein [Oscillospiraceae bacterium]
MWEAAANENVEQIHYEILESPILVYNFQVEDFQTYYVTDSGVLVHNSCKGDFVFDENQEVSTV